MILCHGWAGGTRFFFKGRLIEPVLGGPRFFVAAVLKPRHGYPILLSWRMVPASVRHTSFFGVRPRSGHLQAVGCTRWLLDGCFTTKAAVFFKIIPRAPAQVSYSIWPPLACAGRRNLGSLCASLLRLTFSASATTDLDDLTRSSVICLGTGGGGSSRKIN